MVGNERESRVGGGEEEEGRRRRGGGGGFQFGKSVCLCLWVCSTVCCVCVYICLCVYMYVCVCVCVCVCLILCLFVSVRVCFGQPELKSFSSGRAGVRFKSKYRSNGFFLYFPLIKVVWYNMRICKILSSFIDT